MSLDYIIAGNYGQVLAITVKDYDTSAASNISGFSTGLNLQIEQPSGTVVTRIATFGNDGTSGVLNYTVTTTDFASHGAYKLRALLINDTEQLKTEWAHFRVLD